VEHTSGVRAVLSSGRVYSLFQRLAGAERARRWLAEHFWQFPANGKIVEIGCGTGDLVPYLPPGASYAGFDPSEAYVELATRRYAGRKQTVFLAGTSALLQEDARLHQADLVLCDGVLHHLDRPEAVAVLEFARGLLAPHGVFRAKEPCYVSDQSLLSRLVMGMDRGGNILTETGWRDLLGGVFSVESDTRVMRGLIRLPYVHVLLSGWLPGSRGNPPVDPL
jgi:SAM-dependent methyltransferase